MFFFKKLLQANLLHFFLFTNKINAFVLYVQHGMRIFGIAALNIWCFLQKSETTLLNDALQNLPCWLNADFRVKAVVTVVEGSDIDPFPAGFEQLGDGFYHIQNVAGGVQEKCGNHGVH